MKQNKLKGGADIFDCLAEEQLKDLIELANEPPEKDTISMEEFNMDTKRWRPE